MGICLYLLFRVTVARLFVLVQARYSAGMVVQHPRALFVDYTESPSLPAGSLQVMGFASRDFPTLREAILSTVSVGSGNIVAVADFILSPLICLLRKVYERF